jgi:ABC-type amino acid transport substrate-binding protein
MKSLITVLLLMTSMSFGTDTLKVAVHEISPLVMKAGDEYSGFDIETIEAVAKLMEAEVQYVHAEHFTDLFKLLDNGNADVAMGGVTITYDREVKYDFPHPYKKSGMGILIRDEGESDIMGALAIVFNGSFKKIWVAFLLMVILAAHIVWFTERGSPAFHDKYSIGIWEGLWYSVVTVTTVGYGDKVPQKALSKLVAVFVMLIGIGVAGIAMSQLSAVMNVQMVKYSVNTPTDLKGKNVAVVTGTTSETAVIKYNGNMHKAKTIDEAVLMLEAKRVDAVVFDAPTLQYYAINNPALTTVGGIFDIQDYGILLANNSKYKERISLNVLKLKSTGQYNTMLAKWFGDNAE